MPEIINSNRSLNYKIITPTL